MANKLLAVVKPATVFRVISAHRLKFPASLLSTTSSCAAGGKWRIQQGLGRHGNEYGPLQEIPDWSYADGRPAPLWRGEVRRRQKQKELAEHAVRLMAEMKDAKKTFATDKTSQPVHRFVKTDLDQRLLWKRFRVKNL